MNSRELKFEALKARIKAKGSCVQGFAYSSLIP